MLMACNQVVELSRKGRGKFPLGWEPKACQGVFFGGLGPSRVKDWGMQLVSSHLQGDSKRIYMGKCFDGVY